ncbi:metallophosphoesterase [Thermococcus sp. Bubb.Bath]|uniref:metallophosphoesterase n=1 Tax=Thermococcus sp. Bubb.Bath TaxID=1638242 RepID=UPI003183ADC7
MHLLVAVVSDTHVGDKAKSLPIPFLNKLRASSPDLILHAGDITSHTVLEELEEITPVVAVRGNVDHLHLPEEKVVEVGDVSIGMVHGHQFFSLNSHFLALKAMDMGVDVLVFGHTHRFYFEPLSLHGRRVYLLNPGSPMFPRYDSPGFALLRTDGKEVDVRRIELW